MARGSNVTYRPAQPTGGGPAPDVSAFAAGGRGRGRGGPSRSFTFPSVDRAPDQGYRAQPTPYQLPAQTIGPGYSPPTGVRGDSRPSTWAPFPYPGTQSAYTGAPFPGSQATPGTGYRPGVGNYSVGSTYPFPGSQAPGRAPAPPTPPTQPFPGSQAPGVGGRGGGRAGGGGGFQPGGPGPGNPYGGTGGGYTGLPYVGATYPAGGQGGANLPAYQPNISPLPGDPSDWNAMAAHQTSLAEGVGFGLLDYTNAATGAYNQRMNQMGQAGDQLTSWRLQNPGYTADQSAAIMDAPGLNRLQWTQDNQRALDLTSGERSRGVDPITGLPGIYSDYTAERGYFSPDVQGQMMDTANRGVAGMNAAVGPESGIDPVGLGLSDRYSSRYDFGPQDAQNLVNAAGRTVGEGTKAQIDEIRRRTAAAGTNAPLAEAAAEDRVRQTGAVASADAMTLAQIRAKQLGLDVEQTREGTRLGAEQARVGAAQSAGGMRVGESERAAALGLGTQQYISNTGMNLEAQINAGQVAQSQWGAANRQAMTQWGQGQAYQRGAYADQAQSNRATQLAEAQRKDINLGQADIRQQETQAQQGSQTSNAQASNLFSETMAPGQQALSTAGMLKGIQMQQPPWWARLGAAVGAGVGTQGNRRDFSGGGVDSGGGIRRGAVITKPTVATIGESGPETVVSVPSRRGNYYQPGRAA